MFTICCRRQRPALGEPSGLADNPTSNRRIILSSGYHVNGCRASGNGVTVRGKLGRAVAQGQIVVLPETGSGRSNNQCINPDVVESCSNSIIRCCTFWQRYDKCN